MAYINKIPRKEPQKRSKHSNQSARYYNSHQWKLLRKFYITTHPLCEECLAMGISRAAEHVHHKVEFMSGKDDAERWELLLSETNLESLCKMHHQQIHGERHSQKYADMQDVKHKY